MLATLVGKADPTGQNREQKRDRGKPLAGKSTLNRLELTPSDATRKSRYKKIAIDPEAVDDFLLDVFIDAQRVPPERLILDFDAIDDPLHGKQEGRFFETPGTATASRLVAALPPELPRHLRGSAARGMSQKPIFCCKLVPGGQEVVRFTQNCASPASRHAFLTPRPR